MEGTIIKIEDIESMDIGNTFNLVGIKGARLGFSGMLSSLSGGAHMEGYLVETTEHKFLILIDNKQSCCENWGHFSTHDNLQDFVGKELISIELTDTALTTESIEELEYLDGGAVQFVTFKTSDGDFQLAVYNAHNGYYGHGIIVAKDVEILLQDVL
jgi:hypothetical protein